jgi:hypothetical protein
MEEQQQQEMRGVVLAGGRSAHDRALDQRGRTGGEAGESGAVGLVGGSRTVRGHSAAWASVVDWAGGSRWVSAATSGTAEARGRWVLSGRCVGVWGGDRTQRERSVLGAFPSR